MISLTKCAELVWENQRFYSYCSAASVSDPDPYWIRIQSDHWIRIRIRNLNTDPDPDPGGQKLPTKGEKIHVLKCWMASLWAGGFFCNLDILNGGLGIGKLQFLIKKKFNFFFNFWSLKPWIRIGSGSGLVFILRCWIRIRTRMKWIRIRNPANKCAHFLPSVRL